MRGTGMRRAAARLVAALACAAAAGTAAASVHPIVTPLPGGGGQAPNGAVSLPSTSQCLAAVGLRCYQPFQYWKAYNLQPLFTQGLTGAGRTIVIVDSFGSPTIRHDLHVFDQAAGLPDPPSFEIIQPAGPVPPYDPSDPLRVVWAAETTLDVEWAHAMAPGARILLVETPVAETYGVQGFPEIVQAENYVIDRGLGDVISQSFGTAEETFPRKRDLLGLRSAYENAREHDVTVLASTGDQGATSPLPDGTCCYPARVVNWPASDPLVLATGGTRVTLDDRGRRIVPDTAYQDHGAAGGGGVSSVFERPPWQDGLEIHAVGGRALPDVSLSSAAHGGALVYLSFPGLPAGVYIFSGTSEAAPLMAGIVAIADQAAGRRLGWLNDDLYGIGTGGPGLLDVVGRDTSFSFTLPSGQPFTVHGYYAREGYDLATGLGTIDAAALVRRLARQAR